TVKSGGILDAFGLGIASGATLSQEGATTADDVVDNGRILLKAGAFQGDSLVVGTTAKGTLPQAAGTATISGPPRTAHGGPGSSAAADSAYALTLGSLNAGQLTVGVGGRFSQSGGTATIAGAVTNDGSISLSAGAIGATVFNAGSLSLGVGGQGLFTQ